MQINRDKKSHQYSYQFYLLINKKKKYLDYILILKKIRYEKVNSDINQRSNKIIIAIKYKIKYLYSRII